MRLLLFHVTGSVLISARLTILMPILVAVLFNLKFQLRADIDMDTGLRGLIDAQRFEVEIGVPETK